MDDVLEVDLPADTASLRVARLMLWEAATRAGLDCDGADDLCLALDEVCFAIYVRIRPVDRLSLRISSPAGVRVDGHVRAPASAHSDRHHQPVEFGSLAQALLAVSIDELEVDERADGVHFTMIKHAAVLEPR